jgi:transposase
MVSCIQGSSISNGACPPASMIRLPRPSWPWDSAPIAQARRTGMEPKNPSSIVAADNRQNTSIAPAGFTVGLGCGLAARQDCGSRSRRIITNNTCSRGQLSQVGQGCRHRQILASRTPNSPTTVDLPAPTGFARGRQRATVARTNSRSFGRAASGTRSCTRSTRHDIEYCISDFVPLRSPTFFTLKQALCPDPARAVRDSHQPKQSQRTGCPGIGNLELISFIIPSVLETPAKSPNGSVSFQIRGQSVCHV